VPEAGGAGIRRRLAEVLPALIEAHRPRGVGVGFGGPVDGRTGVIRRSHQVPGWEDFPLADWLTERAGRPARVDNDANVAALGEALAGAGRGRRVVFFSTLGSGVGGGLVADGRVYHGAPPGEVEWGHLRLDRAGTIVEERCSGWAVDRRIRALVREHPESALARLTAGMNGGEARHWRAAIEAGDAVARELLDDVADDLAFGLSHVTHLLHPEVIVLGGGLSLVGEPLRRAVADALPPRIMEAFRPGPEIRLAQLGEDSVPVGALLLAGTTEETRGARA
jgi:glucokinase